MFSFWMHLSSHRSIKHNVVFTKSVFHPWLSMSRIFVVVHLKTGKWKYGVSTTPWRPSLITIRTELVLLSFRVKIFHLLWSIFKVLNKNFEGSIFIWWVIENNNILSYIVSLTSKMTFPHFSSWNYISLLMRTHDFLNMKPNTTVDSKWWPCHWFSRVFFKGWSINEYCEPHASLYIIQWQVVHNLNTL